MFQMLFRARSNNSLQADFRTRAAGRDAATDRARIAPIMTAIDVALQDAEKEQAGLNRRVDDALARAAVTLGNESDEYLEREPLNDYHQSLFSAQISNGQRRLAELGTMVSNLRFVKETMLARFPNLRSTALDR
jgi:5'-deoxynucleotidase YfbR-like HD superfamily hydrolase